MGLVLVPIMKLIQEHINLIHFSFLLLMELDQQCLIYLVTRGEGHFKRLLKFWGHIFEILKSVEACDLVWAQILKRFILFLSLRELFHDQPKSAFKLREVFLCGISFFLVALADIPEFEL